MTPKAILVTGSHRSGTSWVGAMVAASQSPRVALLWEPFSTLHRPGVCAARFPYWFPYVCPENAGHYRGAVADMLRYRYRPGAELRSLRGPKDAARMARDWLQFERHRRSHAVPLLKDPLAVLSAEWLSDAFGMEPVVMIRHPAAFAHSLKRLGMSHPFDHFLRQPLLMRDLLEPFEPEIRRFSATPPPILDQAILLWRIIYSVAAAYRLRRPGWVFLRHEDVARDPQRVFLDLYARLGLDYDDRVRATVAAYSAPSNPRDVPSPSPIRRDSESTVVTWKSRLTPEEIGRVRRGTEDVWPSFYRESEW
jgi:hypothetical protein